MGRVCHHPVNDRGSPPGMARFRPTIMLAVNAKAFKLDIDVSNILPVLHQYNIGVTNMWDP